MMKKKKMLSKKRAVKKNVLPVEKSKSDAGQIQAILEARHEDPFSFLGPQSSPNAGASGKGMVVRVIRPEAKALWIVPKKGVKTLAKKVHADGFFEAFFPEASEASAYMVEWTDFNGKTFLYEDPYAFGNVLGEQDMYFFSEGTHRKLAEVFGPHEITLGGVKGMFFSVWAPNAQRVSIVGDFNKWDGRVFPMRKRIEAGVWEIFLPGVGFEVHYKFEVRGQHGDLVLKSDPLAYFSQNGPSTASITFDLNRYKWGDSKWMQGRESYDPYHRAVSIYEVHLGSWKRVIEGDKRALSYRELADELVDYVKDLGFTHIELMPITEFPFDGSWGYQVVSYFAPTSRFGNPDEFRYFVDKCHQVGIGVILDWVPAHFPKDAHGLARFDGSALYEHDDPRKGEHKDWGTLIFNYGRNEVRNFLIANALFWLREYHLDGLRVDAVASMLYLDYSREEGEWLPNEYGGRENLEAIDFMRQLNEACYEEFPGVLMMAEESTAWGGVSRPTSQGGLGFGFKWNMGWMNDMLDYMSKEPVHRKFHHNEATFSMVYAYDENFILVLSHDEVVHGKRSLLDKMPGDRWQKFANLRMFYAWMYGHPGKKLLFQGCEFAQSEEWNFATSLDWHLLQYPEHKGMQRLIKDLNQIYTEYPAIYTLDHEAGGFHWVDHNDTENSTFAFWRQTGDGGQKIVFVVNATPVPRRNYRLGVPEKGRYREIINSDSELYAGSNLGNFGGVNSEDVKWHGQEQSVEVILPPLATVAFLWEGDE